MILADEYEELKAGSIRTGGQVLKYQDNVLNASHVYKRGNDQWSPPHQVQRQQAAEAPRGGP